jgi:hypothetical protein
MGQNDAGSGFIQGYSGSAIFDLRTDTSSSIAGWTFDDSSLGGTNLTMYSSGLIETNDFVSGLKGWRIDQTGLAEFDNAVIRGSLSTVSFDKQTINAVGGQL